MPFLDGLWAVSSVAVSIEVDAFDWLACGHVGLQRGQYQRNADGVAGHLNDASFQRLRVDAEVHPKPFTPVLAVVFLRCPFAYADS